QESSDYDGSVFAEDSEPETVKPKTRKRIRKDRQGSDAPVEPPIKRSRGKQGMLKGLMNMPIEVFTEIAKYLYPLDLILLSRANKFFRQLLLSRSATQTWQHALSNVDGLPPCPEQLCEPQYAALMFTKYCSMCGKQTPRPMDPILLVRLCVPCRDEQIRPVEPGEYDLLPMSSAIVPAKKKRRSWCCLRKDALTLHSELEALQLAGDRVATSRWMERKRQEMARRIENTRPLIAFLEQQETEHNDSLVARRGQREEAIRSRLLELGWVKGDFEMCEKHRMKQWKSLVCVARPLTERNWKTILPQLTPLLERSRELRLAAEASQRGQQRYLKTSQWISSTLKELEPYARILDWPGKTTADSVPGSDSLQIQGMVGPSKLDDKVLKTPLPADCVVLAWNPFKELLRANLPMEEFEVALVGMRPTLDQLLTEWRANFEKALIEHLPSSGSLITKDTSALTPSTTTLFDVIPKLAIEVNSQPIKDLPLDTQRLLRADTVWNYTYSTILHFYPDGFQSVYNGDASSLNYNTKASKIANVLLPALGCPDAMYLQVKAAGPAFTCGRCHNYTGMSWDNLLQHYLDEQEKWDKVQTHPFFKHNRITYVFTHYTEVVEDDKPLVRMASNEERFSNHFAHYSNHPCLVCLPMNMDGCYYHTEAGVMDHVHSVHLIQDPKKNVHYR
ncbi:hypothetical protein FS749_009578, partial [Ceratobasidium sp. UAMH 11750]